MQKQKEQIAKTEELITFNFWHFVMISQPNNNFIGMCNVTCQAFRLSWCKLIVEYRNYVKEKILNKRQSRVGNITTDMPCQ